MRRFTTTADSTYALPVAENVLAQTFVAMACNMGSDTYIAGPYRRERSFMALARVLISGVSVFTVTVGSNLVRAFRLDSPDSTMHPRCFNCPVSMYHFTAHADEQLSYMLARDHLVGLLTSRHHLYYALMHANYLES